VIIDKKGKPDKKSKNTAICEATKSFLGKLFVLPKYTNLSKLTLPIKFIVDGTAILRGLILCRL